MNPIYPWSAVVGQEQLKHALLLCAIDPAIGGVLVQGQRGVAKTTLARALGELSGGPFVELPLGASEERVTGTLDLSKALRDGHVEFSPGLLSRAHQGVLYVDEVNLLSDSLVDLLLDAAASGRNTVERDGISHVHAARFVLVGTMNPEEGELRPQLTDRFGLCVIADTQLVPALRTQIVLRRLAFERDPDAFRAQYAEEQARLSERCKEARLRAEQMELSGPGLERVAEHCYAAGVEGVRADLAMLRAARAHAAWHQRTEIGVDDVDAVAELALLHRRGKHAEPHPPSGGKPPQGSGNPQTPPSKGGGTPTGGSSGSRQSAGERGAMQAVPVKSAARVNTPGWLTRASCFAEPRRKGLRSLSLARGKRTREESTQGAIDWFATLARAPKPQLHQLCYRARKTPPRELWILAIDCSMSMLRGGGLSQAKGLAQSLQAEAHKRGAHVALISFGGSDAQLNSDAKSARGHVQRAIDALSAGGGTPLRQAVEQALSLCSARSFRSEQIQKRVLLATDGRTRQQLSDLSVARRDVEWLVVDCEGGPVKLGRAPQLARELGARCIPVAQL